jgi:hypothetical protein
MCENGLCVLRAFVAPVVSGNLGGYAGAESTCRGAAAAGGLTSRGKFLPWLSDSTKTARERFGPNAPRGRVVSQGQGATTKTIFNSFRDALVLPGTPIESIDYDATGMLRQGYGVWTGTQSGGGSATDTCSNWMSNSTDQGTYGITSDSAKWTNAGLKACNSTDLYIYCIEQ